MMVGTIASKISKNGRRLSSTWKSDQPIKLLGRPMTAKEILAEMTPKESRFKTKFKAAKNKSTVRLKPPERILT